MGKTRNTGKLATQIQFDNSNNLYYSLLTTGGSHIFNGGGIRIDGLTNYNINNYAF
jgi:hypothetical protein